MFVFWALICSQHQPNGIMGPGGVHADHHLSIPCYVDDGLSSNSPPCSCMPRNCTTLSSTLRLHILRHISCTHAWLSGDIFVATACPQSSQTTIDIALQRTKPQAKAAQSTKKRNIIRSPIKLKGMNGATKGRRWLQRWAGWVFQYLFNKLHVKTLGAELVEMIII